MIWSIDGDGPDFQAILSGAIGTTVALVRFLGAILVCWILASIVQAVLDRYADSAARREYEVQMSRARAQNPAVPPTDAESHRGPSSWKRRGRILAA